MNAWRTGAALGLLLTLFGCTAFPVIEANVCGNRVIEPGEDCDTFADNGKTCRAPGTVDECHFDCALNADETRAECPSGSGCAADGICRRPTGGFEQALKFASEPSSWVSTVDFDGDQKLDVISAEPADELQQSRFRLHYFDAGWNLVETKVFPRQTTRPIARQLPGKPVDLLFSNFRIGLLPGREDREWVPATFSSYVVPGAGLRVVGVSKDFVGDASALVAVTAIDGVDGAYVPDFITGGLGIRAKLPQPVRNLAGVPIAADLFEGTDSPCSEVVLAYKGAREFRVLDMCESGDAQMSTTLLAWRDTPREQIIKLPAGLVVDAGPLAADVDGDGHLDVMIGAGGHPYLARGDGQQLEPSAQSLELDVYEPQPPPETDQQLEHESSADLDMPLAIGDYSGDGVADFVQPTRLLTSRKLNAGTRYAQSYPNHADAWSMAEIADLNGNGLPDVVVASAGATSLTFFNGTGGPFQIGTTLPTQGPVQLLTTGDFDGDLVGDIAFIQTDLAESSDSLALAFGKRDGLPLPPARVALLSGSEQLSDYGALGLDNLFVAAHDHAGGIDRTKLTLFDNGPDRLPFAPFALVDFSNNQMLEDSAAAVIVAGTLVKPGQLDVVALGSPHLQNDWKAWLVADIGGGQQSPRVLLGNLPDGVVPLNSFADGRKRLSVVGTAADVDRDGLDETLWLASRGEAGCALFIAKVDADAGSFVSRGRIDFDERCPSPELAAVDLDGDEALDLLLLIGDPEQTARKIQVFWNDGQGGFSTEARSFVADPDGRDVRSFSAFSKAGLDQSRQTPQIRLAFVTDNSLEIVSAAVGANAPASVSAARQFDQLTTVQSFSDARSVAVTDPNGDHIEDLVVADAAGLWLVKAQLR